MLEQNCRFIAAASFDSQFSVATISVQGGVYGSFSEIVNALVQMQNGIQISFGYRTQFLVIDTEA